MRNDAGDTFLAHPTQPELGRRAIEVVGYLLATGIRLERRALRIAQLFSISSVEISNAEE
jgi:hypothetical protein